MILKVIAVIVLLVIFLWLILVAVAGIAALYAIAENGISNIGEEPKDDGKGSKDDING